MNMGQWVERIPRELAPVHVELKPLGEADTVQMLQTILSPPANDFIHWLYNETRGQPFYLIETLKDLLERRVLHPKWHKEGQWTFALDAEHDLGKAVRVPSTVHRVIRARLNRLSPNAFSLLAAGAVLDQQITFERMCIISNLTKDLALPALDELISGRLLVEALYPGGASGYAFTNDMLRDVVYTEAGDARRRLFHQRALESLAEANESAAVLAHHAQAAGQAQTVFNYSLDAGYEALNLSAVKEAIVHLERARQFVHAGEIPDPGAKTDLRNLYSLLSQAYKLVGQTDNALAIDAEWDRLG